MAAASTLSSDELNLLVYRYLLESGFVHSAFTFSNESLVTRSNINAMEVPPGALVSFVQKGLQYYEIEAHVHEDGTESICDEPFSVITPHSCRVKRKRKVFDGPSGADQTIDDYGHREVALQSVSTLRGHTDVVTACAWNQQGTLLASASGDGTARIWEGANGNANEAPLVLRHDNNTLPSTDSTALAASSSIIPPIASLVSLDWAHDGLLLATGLFSGQVAVWSKSGQLVSHAQRHSAPVSVLRFSAADQWLASASMDGTVCVADTRSDAKSEFHVKSHNGPVIEMDWSGDAWLASVAAAGTVFVHRIDASGPVSMELAAHDKDAVSVRWSPSGRMLATGSDDHTVKVWQREDSDLKLLHKLDDHGGAVTCVRFGAQTDRPLLLASASLDCTVKLWDAESGRCIRTFNEHSFPVIALEFAPSADLIASIAYDRLHVWSTREGKLIKTYKAVTSINDLSWAPSGDRIALCLANNSVCIVHL